MGAWGYGILQNDTAQDGMCEVARYIEEEISSLSERSNEQNAALIGAAVGLLLQFSPYSFNPENEFYNKLIHFLNQNKKYFIHLPKEAAQILNSIIDGQGSELSERHREIDHNIYIALYSNERNEGPIQRFLQKDISVCEDALFEHPVAIRYLNHITEYLVKKIDEDFSDDEVVADLSREGMFMGAFSLLLLLPHCRVSPEKFQQWRNRFHEVWKHVEPSTDETEKRFENQYNKYLELAFQCGIAKFSNQE